MPGATAERIDMTTYKRSQPTAVFVRFQAVWTASADIVSVGSHISTTALGYSATATPTATSTVLSG